MERQNNHNDAGKDRNDLPNLARESHIQEEAKDINRQ